MNFLTEEMGVGNIGFKMIAEQRKLAESRWTKTGLLEGLQGHKRNTIAQLFENQLTEMIKKKSLYESTTSDGSNGQFTAVAFPIIRRVFSKLLAQDIVSIQALAMPIGKLFFLNPKISRRRIDAGAQAHFEPDGAYENAATSTSKTEFEQKSLYDSFYSNTNSFGEGLFDRSKGRYTEQTLVVGNAPTLSGVTTTQWTVPLTGFTTTNQGKLVGSAGIPIDTESFLASLEFSSNIDLIASEDPVRSIAAGKSIPFNVRVQRYADAIAEGGVLTVVLDLSYGGNGNVAKGFDVPTAPVISAKYRVYSTLEEDSEMAEVTFEMKEIEVAVETRKMRANWTPEMAQDVSAFQNIDAEAELTALLSEAVAAEIDLEVMRDLYKGAAWYDTWDYRGREKSTNTYFGVQKDYNQELIAKINRISAQIYKTTLRAGASFIVVSPEVSAVFDDLEYFHVSNAAPEQNEYAMGIEKIGNLSSRYQVYRAPYLPADTCLIGHKGKSFLETGYVYCPYVPLALTPVIINPFDFTQIRGIMTRYAKKMVQNRYYGRIKVEGLKTFENPF